MRRLAGRLAVITGAANGIGRASAIRMASEGANIVMIDREVEALEAARAAVEQQGAKATTMVLDCTDEVAIVDAFARIAADHPPIDILMNNVGQSARERAAEFHVSKPEVWRFVLDVSLMPTLTCTRQVVPAMRDRRSGRIINVASNAGLAGEIGLADYAAAKMGVIGFTRALARELGPFHVNVNALCPGTTHTRVMQQIAPETVAKITQMIPMGYMAEPEDIAAVAAFLASDDARYMTGQSVVVDGGRWMV
jgi:NAD(P)-dependent dehydrogenase (short-subunit alcohol dehydrogenase family)